MDMGGMSFPTPFKEEISSFRLKDYEKLIQQRYTDGLDKINNNFSPSKSKRRPSSKYDDQYAEQFGKPKFSDIDFTKKPSLRNENIERSDDDENLDQDGIQTPSKLRKN
jgi:hypothetical protein